MVITVILTRIRSLKALRTDEIIHLNPVESLNFKINRNIGPKTIKDLGLFISKHLVITKVSLGYIIQNNEMTSAITIVTLDPAVGSAETTYLSHSEKKIDRASYFWNIIVSYTENYVTDNATVWPIISTSFKTHSLWTIVWPFHKDKDGRNSFIALYQHNLVPNAIDNISSSSEKNSSYASTWGNPRIGPSRNTSGTWTGTRS